MKVAGCCCTQCSDCRPLLPCTGDSAPQTSAVQFMHKITSEFALQANSAALHPSARQQVQVWRVHAEVLWDLTAHSKSSVPFNWFDQCAAERTFQQDGLRQDLPQATVLHTHWQNWHSSFLQGPWRRHQPPSITAAGDRLTATNSLWASCLARVTHVYHAHDLCRHDKHQLGPYRLGHISPQPRHMRPAAAAAGCCHPSPGCASCSSCSSSPPTAARPAAAARTTCKRRASTIQAAWSQLAL